MAAENAGSIYAEVRIRLDQLTNDLKQATTKIDSFEKGVQDGTANAAKKAEANLSKISVAAVAASAAIGFAFRSLITSTAEYSQALSDVQAATRGTAADLAALEGAAASAGDELATSTTDALGAVEALAKAGVSTADIMGGALPGALTLAAAGSMNVADAAEIAAATMTQFGLAGSDVTHIADLLAAGAGKAQGEVSDLSQALKQAGLVASQTGLSVDDTVGSLAAFASAGLLGSDAGTSFRTMLLRLTPQSKEAADEMKKLGINAFDAKGEFIGITAFAGQLKEQLKNLTTEQRNSALATIFGSDSIRAANVLYTQGAEGIASWIDKVNDSGFAATTARIKLNNLAGDMKKFDAATKDAATGVGKALDPTLRGITQTLTGAIDLVGKLDSTFVAFASAAVLVAGGIAGISGALGLLGVSTAAVFGPIGLAVTAVTALVAGIGAAAAAANDAEIKAAGEKFGFITENSEVAAETLVHFAETARKVEDRLAFLSKQGTRVSAEGFQELARSAGLTNDQLAQIALASDRAGTELKKLATTFIDPIRQQKEFAAAQKASADAIVGRYQKLSEEGKKTAAALLPTVKTISDAIAYQNYLESIGLITAEESLTAKIKLRNEEIERIQKAGEETGKLTAAQQTQIKTLMGFNAENQASLEALSETETTAAETQLGFLADLDAASQEYYDQRDKDAQDSYDLQTALLQEFFENDERARGAQLKQIKGTADATVSVFDGLISVLSAVFAAMNQRQVDALTSQYEHEKELIENNGKTKQQTLEDNLATALATGDAQAIADAQRSLDLFNLDKKFTKDKAELEYQGALQSWRLQVLSTAAQAAQAVLNAWTSTAAIPLIGVGLAPGAAALAAVIGGLQIAAVGAAMPTPPKFATGGIVLGNATSGDTIPAMVNSREMILTQEQQAQLFSMANGGGGRGGGSMVLILEIDGKRVAQTTADWINSGQIRVKIG